MQNQFGIISMIQQGYYATYPLLFISVVCLAIIFERTWSLRGIGPQAAKMADALIAPLRQGRFNEALQQVQGQRTAGERIYYSVISAAQTMDREHLMDLEEERRFR